MKWYTFCTGPDGTSKEMWMALSKNKQTKVSTPKQRQHIERFCFLCVVFIIFCLNTHTKHSTDGCVKNMWSWGCQHHTTHCIYELKLHLCFSTQMDPDVLSSAHSSSACTENKAKSVSSWVQSAFISFVLLLKCFIVPHINTSKILFRFKTVKRVYYTIVCHGKVWALFSEFVILWEYCWPWPFTP